MCYESVIEWLYPKCLNKWIKVDKFDYVFQTKITAFEKKNVLGSYEYLKRLGGKTRKCVLFYVKIFLKNGV